MPDTETGNRGRDRQKIPRIGPEEAARVFAQCEHLLEVQRSCLSQGGHNQLRLVLVALELFQLCRLQCAYQNQSQ